MIHNGYTPMGYTTQGNLQIQCNLYQMNNGIFHITKTKYLIICVGTQRASLVAQLIKNPPAMQETLIQFLGWEEPLEKG